MSLKRVLPALALAACSTEEVTPQYQTVEAEIGAIRDIVPARGRVEAAAAAEISSEISGRIADVAVDVEARVSQGDLLARFDAAPFEARRARAFSQHEAARASEAEAEALLGASRHELETAQELAERGNVAEGRVTQLQYTVDAREAALVRARAQSEVAQAELDQAELDLARVDIRAPFDGFVLERHVDPGDVVNAIQSAPHLFTIAANLDDVIIRAEVAERDIARIIPEMSIRASVDAYPGQMFQAELARIERAPIVRGRFVAFPVVLEAAASDGRLLPGMTTSVEFVRAEAEDVLLSPISALYFTPDGYIADLPQDLLDSMGLSANSMSPEALAISINAAEAGWLFPQGLRRIFVLEDGAPSVRYIRVGAEDRDFVAISGDAIGPGDAIIIAAQSL